MNQLDWNELWDEDAKRYRVQTRDGRKVRIFTIEARDPIFPIVGEVDDGHTDKWTPLRWTNKGCLLPSPGDSRDDLVPEPRTVRRWANVYWRCDGTYYIANVDDLYTSESDARKRVTDTGKHIATVPVEWQE